MTGEQPITLPPSPPKAVIMVLNTLIALLLRSPLHRIMSGSCILLSFTGQKSGKRYTFPVGYYQYEGNTLRIIPLHGWWKNLRGNVPVTIWLKGRRYSATADASQGDETTVNELEPILRASANHIRIFKIEHDGQLVADRLHLVATSLALVRIHLITTGI